MTALLCWLSGGWIIRWLDRRRAYREMSRLDALKGLGIR